MGEHDWGATYDNRWGSKLSYEHSSLDIQAGYFLSGEDLNGATEFGAVDKTFQWKAAIARPDKPVEYGFFGSSGTVPVGTGIDQYGSFAAYLQIDPKPSGIPGLLAIAQHQHDGNPGVEDNTGLVMPGTSSHGLSLELFEPLAAGNVVVSFRHDINSDGFRTVTVGNALNIGANVPGIEYLHAYFESALGGTSSLLGASGGSDVEGNALARDSGGETPLAKHATGTVESLVRRDRTGLSCVRSPCACMTSPETRAGSLEARGKSRIGTSLWPCSPLLEGIGGRYFVDCNEALTVARRTRDMSGVAPTRSTPAMRIASGSTPCGCSREAPVTHPDPSIGKPF